ncbi:hypothetical protein OOT33_00105 [Sphingobium sp. DEHP117]|uniref:hypothetical protein n=1 Tax=Sphingobium sp. DEHP117 TaxID=2993436 RepID=UPI0027D484EE|nr:hypothetical protein [Sphingobium sp. DEHP117]MDQ4418849.1 hypothetical protein [Sphingobium sp. DEHP117]
MTGLPPDLVEKYRAAVPHIQLSEETLAVICKIMRAGVAIAWGLDSTQLALKQQFSNASLSDSDCASLGFHEKIETVDPVDGGAKNKIGPKDYAP